MNKLCGRIAYVELKEYSEVKVHCGTVLCQNSGISIAFANGIRLVLIEVVKRVLVIMEGLYSELMEPFSFCNVRQIRKLTKNKHDRRQA